MIIPSESFIVNVDSILTVIRCLNELYLHECEIYIIKEPCIGKVRLYGKSNIVYMCLGPNTIVINYDEECFKRIADISSVKLFILESDIWCKSSLFKPSVKVHDDEITMKIIEYLNLHTCSEGLCSIKGTDFSTLHEYFYPRTILVPGKCDVIRLSDYRVQVLNPREPITYGIDLLFEDVEFVDICKLNLKERIDMDVLATMNDYPLIVKHIPSGALIITLRSPAKLLASIIGLCLFEVCGIDV